MATKTGMEVSVAIGEAVSSHPFGQLGVPISIRLDLEDESPSLNAERIELGE